MRNEKSTKNFASYLMWKSWHSSPLALCLLYVIRNSICILYIWYIIRSLNLVERYGVLKFVRKMTYFVEFKQCFCDCQIHRVMVSSPWCGYHHYRDRPIIVWVKTHHYRIKKWQCHLMKIIVRVKRRLWSLGDGILFSSNISKTHREPS